jgi:YegS/Rv2252/BmrU family lipid kinase
MVNDRDSSLVLKCTQTSEFQISVPGVNYPMTHYLFILNPTSDRGNAAHSVSSLTHRLQELKLDYELIQTERPWHAPELARQAVQDGFKVVVAVGGDGTANEVLNGLMQAKHAGEGEAALGLIGIGRGNDFAFGMHVPNGLEVGCQVLAEDHRRLVDVGKVQGGLFPDGRYFGNGIGIGFDAVVGFEALKMTRLHGFISYVVAALKTTFLYYKAPLVRIEHNRKTTELYALMVSIMNGRRMGGGFMMAPEAQNNDGLLDLCIARQVSRPMILALIPRFMAGTQASHPAIRMERTTQITVSAVEGALPAHADGETLCEDGEKLTVDLLPAQLEVICQAEGSSE